MAWCCCDGDVVQVSSGSGRNNGRDLYTAGRDDETARGPKSGQDEERAQRQAETDGSGNGAGTELKRGGLRYALFLSLDVVGAAMPCQPASHPSSQPASRANPAAQ